MSGHGTRKPFHCIICRVRWAVGVHHAWVVAAVCRRWTQLHFLPKVIVLVAEADIAIVPRSSSTPSRVSVLLYTPVSWPAIYQLHYYHRYIDRRITFSDEPRRVRWRHIQWACRTCFDLVQTHETIMRVRNVSNYSAAVAFFPLSANRSCAAIRTYTIIALSRHCPSLGFLFGLHCAVSLHAL